MCIVYISSYQEGLLDRQEILTWLLELLEKVKITDDSVLKLILAQVMKVRLVFVFFFSDEEYTSKYFCRH